MIGIAEFFRSGIKMKKILMGSLPVSIVILSLLGCGNPEVKKAGEKTKESTAKAGEAARDLGRGISDETGVIVEEIKKGANVVVTKVKGGGIYVSKKGEALIDKTKEEFSDTAITAKIKAKYVKSPQVSALHIGVSTVKGRVILTGKVRCKDEIIEAINLAVSVEGVGNVTSLLEIRK